MLLKIEQNNRAQWKNAIKFSFSNITTLIYWHIPFSFSLGYKPLHINVPTHMYVLTEASHAYVGRVLTVVLSKVIVGTVLDEHLRTSTDNVVQPDVPWPCSKTDEMIQGIVTNPSTYHM